VPTESDFHHIDSLPEKRTGSSRVRKAANPDKSYRLCINAVPLRFTDDIRLAVGRLPYEGAEAFKKLRQDLRGTHLVRRQGDEVEVVVRHAELELPGDRQEVNAADEPELVAALMHEWLLDCFAELKRPVFRNRHELTLVSTKPEDDLLRLSLPNGVTLPIWLGVRVTYNFNIRVLAAQHGGHRQIWLMCESRSRTIIDTSVAELLGIGVDICGKYVRKTDERLDDERVLPHRPLAGRVLRVEDDVLVLADHRADCATVPTTSAFLEPRTENLEQVTRAIEPVFADAILRALKRNKAKLASGPDRLSRIARMFDYIRSKHIALVPGSKLQVGPLVSMSGDFPQHELMQKPDMIFDAGGRRTHRWPQGGLDAHGPFDSYQFTPKQLNVAVICQARVQGRVEQFVRKLLHGLPSSDASGGFLRRFRLDRPFVRIFSTPTADAADYRQACIDAVEYITDQGKRWNLALVQLDEGMEALAGDENPYLVAKAFFLAKGVPIQQVEFETMEQEPIQLAYALNNVGLACYAKLGGVPWLLPADQKVAHELVIGLGSYSIASSRLGGAERFVGITTVFTGDGRYLLESRTNAVPFSEYATAMLRAVEQAVNNVREEQNWQVHDPIRLVFHAFKPMKDSEIEAVRRLMAALGLPHAEFAFLHVVDDHPFLIFNESERGANAPGGSPKGELAPPRGLRVALSKRESLIAFKGPREVKQASDGLPRPVLLRLHRDSTFHVLTYLSRQAFSFSCHSWRTFLPSPMPITILYSQLMARNLRLLQDVSGWSPEDIIGPIGRTRWFL
jgi:hypothetical protein